MTSEANRLARDKSNVLLLGMEKNSAIDPRSPLPQGTGADLRGGDFGNTTNSLTCSTRSFLFFSRCVSVVLMSYVVTPWTLQRLSAASDAAEKYLAHFQPYSVTLIARFVRFVAGAFVAVLIALALVDEDVLLDSHVIGRHVHSPQILFY